MLHQSTEYLIIGKLSEPMIPITDDTLLAFSMSGASIAPGADVLTTVTFTPVRFFSNRGELSGSDGVNRCGPVFWSYRRMRVRGRVVLEMNTEQRWRS